MRDSLFMASNGINDMFPIRILNTSSYAGRIKYLRKLLLKID